jgi:hypothetical protein
MRFTFQSPCSTFVVGETDIRKQDPEDSAAPVRPPYPWLCSMPTLGGCVQNADVSRSTLHSAHTVLEPAVVGVPNTRPPQRMHICHCTACHCHTVTTQCDATVPREALQPTATTGGRCQNRLQHVAEHPITGYPVTNCIVIGTYFTTPASTAGTGAVAPLSSSPTAIPASNAAAGWQQARVRPAHGTGDAVGGKKPQALSKHPHASVAWCRWWLRSLPLHPSQPHTYVCVHRYTRMRHVW